MTTPRYLLDAGALDGVAAGAELVLDGDEGRHAVVVRRTRVGERVDVADGSGRVARCRVRAVAAGAAARLDLTVDVVEPAAPRVPRLVLVQALAKAGRDELAVETATELGVDEVVPWQAERSVVVWSGERGARAQRKWESVTRAAAKQSRRATVPLVSAAVSTAVLAARIAALTSPGTGVGTAQAPGVAYVLHEAAEVALALIGPATRAREIVVVVGPEGGIAADESARLTAAGASLVRLGPEVLRTSSAGAAALAVLSAGLGRWA